MNNLVLVNKNLKLPKRYIPDNLVVCDENKYNFHKYLDPKLKPMIEKEVFYQFELLHNAALEDGFDIIIDSGYRSYDYQNMIWEMNVAEKLKEMKEKYPNMCPGGVFNLAENLTNRYVAKPGYSEHQTGLAFDFGAYRKGWYNQDVSNTPESEWMAKNAYKFGFILRYPDGKENITGYAFEPWHYRYVGLPYSQEMYEDDLTLEEYHKLVLKK